MKAILFVFLLLAFLPSAGSAPPEAAVRRSMAMATKTIPHLEIKDASLEEGLAAIRRAWEEQYLDDPFLVGITNYHSSDEKGAKAPALLTLDLKNIPFIEALRYLAQLAHRRFIPQNGLFQLEEVAGIREDWTVRLHPITPAAAAALGLVSHATVDLRKIFRNFGVKLEDWMQIEFAAQDGNLVVSSCEAQQEQIAGVLFLLNQGFRISR